MLPLRTTGDLLITNCISSDKLAPLSAFVACLAQSRVCFGTVPSVGSIRSVSRVGHGVGQRIFPLRICAAINKKVLRPQIQREDAATLSSLAQPTYCKPGFRGIPVYPPLGGASRAPGLPQVAAWCICGRSSHPLREKRQMLTRRPLSRLCRPCVPLSGGGRENTQDTPIEAARPHENSEKERLQGPRFGPFGGVRF